VLSSINNSGIGSGLQYDEQLQQEIKSLVNETLLLVVYYEICSEKLTIDKLLKVMPREIFWLITGI